MNYGFIGLGNMAGAIIKGMKDSGEFSGDAVYGVNRSPEKTRALAESCGLIPCESVRELCGRCDVVVLAVKPGMLDDVLPDVGQSLKAGALVISIAAGKTLEYLESRLEGAGIVRAMPNINALVGASTTALCRGKRVGEEGFQTAKSVFLSVGTVSEVPESLFSVFSAAAGCSPAFTYLYIDALARAAVREGMPRAGALETAASAVLGSAKAVLETGVCPAELADRVCSPGGVTIEGVLKLRELGFENAVHKAFEAMVEKDKRL